MSLPDFVLQNKFTLGLDQAYFGAAQLSLANAIELRDRIKVVVGELESRGWYSAFVGDDQGDEVDFSVLEEQVSAGDIDVLEEDECKLRALISRYIQDLASVPVFSAAALEAHINSVAHRNMGGRFLDEFDRLSLEAKWLFLPPLLGDPVFNIGAEPFQGFRRMVTLRNKLVHAKRSAVVTLGDILGDTGHLGLTISAARSSVDSADAMVQALRSVWGWQSSGWELKKRRSKTAP